MAGKLGLAEIDLKGNWLVLNNKIRIGFSEDACKLLNGGTTLGKLMVVPMEDPNKDDVELIALIEPQDLGAKIPKWAPYKKSELFSEAVEDGDLKGNGLKPYKGKRFSFAGVQVNITQKADLVIKKFNESNKGKDFALRAGEKEGTFVFGIDDKDLSPSAKIKSIDVISDLLKQNK